MTEEERNADTIPPPPAPYVIKTCPCGAEFTASEWNKLPYVGVMSDGGDGELEMRNCNVCASSLVLAI